MLTLREKLSMGADALEGSRELSRRSPVGICAHGYWLSDCALCLKRRGECDYGSCTEAAVGRVGVEQRPMCARHGGSR